MSKYTEDYERMSQKDQKEYVLLLEQNVCDLARFIDAKEEKIKLRRRELEDLTTHRSIFARVFQPPMRGEDRRNHTKITRDMQEDVDRKKRELKMDRVELRLIKDIPRRVMHEVRMRQKKKRKVWRLCGGK